MWKEVKTKNFFENKLLQLDSRKSKKQLKWKSVLTFDETIELTVDWYRKYLENKNMKTFTLKQIEFFEKFYKFLPKIEKYLLQYGQVWASESDLVGVFFVVLFACFS